RCFSEQRRLGHRAVLSAAITRHARWQATEEIKGVQPVTRVIWVTTKHWALDKGNSDVREIQSLCAAETDDAGQGGLHLNGASGFGVCSDERERVGRRFITSA